ncbi:AbrB/MazE/SpoVT family DNA-binding domain-containing protein [Synechococcus sp. UW140]|uniref:AbrB/MazE/SpoVT family DNA-binding domain-containing protein n=1 Tax=Synechococcus sp. UW140 TaxID=368503 RepID=UPI0031382E2F
MTSASSKQALRRWGNSLGVRLPVAIAREAHFLEDQEVELTVVEEGVLIRAAQKHLSLEQRLAAYKPMAAEATEPMAWPPVGKEVLE